jgi:predicted ATPase
VVRGEAGIGKSRLVHEFLEVLSGSPVLTFQAACAPFSRVFPYYPFIASSTEAWVTVTFDLRARVR